jgi:hypothetical protein
MTSNRSSGLVLSADTGCPAAGGEWLALIADLELEHYVRLLANPDDPPPAPDHPCGCGDPRCRLHAAIEESRGRFAPHLAARTRRLEETPTEPPAGVKRQPATERCSDST